MKVSLVIVNQNSLIGCYLSTEVCCSPAYDWLLSHLIDIPQTRLGEMYCSQHHWYWWVSLASSEVSFIRSSCLCLNPWLTSSITVISKWRGFCECWLCPCMWLCIIFGCWLSALGDRVTYWTVSRVGSIPNSGLNIIFYLSLTRNGLNSFYSVTWLSMAIHQSKYFLLTKATSSVVHTTPIGDINYLLRLRISNAAAPVLITAFFILIYDTCYDDGK